MRFSETIKIDKVQELIDLQYKVMSIPVAIFDIDGTLLVSAGRQQICTGFQNDEIKKDTNCMLCDSYLQKSDKSSVSLFKCENGLWEVAIPIIINGENLATLFLGQFFLEEDKVDVDFFLKLARNYGYDEKYFFDFIKTVQTYSKTQVDDFINYYKSFALFITSLSYKNIDLDKQQKTINSMNELMRVTLNSIDYWLHIIDKDFNIVYANEKILQMCKELGIEGDITGYNIFEIFQFLPKDRIEDYFKCFETGKSHEIQEYFDLNGKKFNTITQKIPIIDNDQVVQILTIIRDVSKIQVKDNLIIENEIKYRNIVHNSSEGIILIDNQFTIIEWNKSCEDITGIPYSDAINNNFLQIIQTLFPKGSRKDNLIEITSEIKNTLITGNSEYKDKRRFYKIISNSNEDKYIQIKYYHFKLKSGSVVCCIINNVTSYQIAMDELTKSRDYFEIVANSISDAIFRVSRPERIIQFVNKSVERIFGYTKDELLGNDSRFLFASDYAYYDYNQELMNSILYDEQVFLYETQLMRKNGELFYCEISTTPLFENGKVIAGISIIRDISDRKNTELERENLIQQLQETQNNLKEHSIEILDLYQELSASEEELRQQYENQQAFFSLITHDIKSPFSAFLALAKNLTERFDTFSTEEIKDLSAEMYETANKVYNLLEELLQWLKIKLKRVEYEPESIQLNKVVDMIFELYTQNAKIKNIKLISNIPDDLWIYADLQNINAVLRNLISNSIKFTNSGGTVTVNSINLENSVKIEVKDTGIGMTEKQIENLFKIDKYISTLGTNHEKGTGLGLILCKEMIKKENSDLVLESKENEGTSISFEIKNNVLPQDTE